MRPLTFMVGRSRLATLRLLATLLLALLLPHAAMAQTGIPPSPTLYGGACAADKQGSKLTCNANDVAITQIAINRNVYAGVNQKPILTGGGCVGGATYYTNLNVTVAFNSPSRYNIGIFLSQDGGNPQLQSSQGGAKSCTVSMLPLGTPNLAAGLVPNPFSGTGTVPTPFQNLDGNWCGDGSNNGVPTSGWASSTGNPSGTGTATFVITDVPIVCAASTAAPVSNKLTIPFVVTWDQNSGTCNGPADLSPGTTSKCNVPGGVQGDVDVVTLPSITKTDGVTSVSVGDTTTYTITVANTTGAPIGASTLRDPAVTGLQVSNVACAAAGAGASCPTIAAGAPGVTAFQSGITLPSLPANATLTFSVQGTFTSTGVGSTASPWVPAPNSQVTNAATVTVNGVPNTATDANTMLYPSLQNAKTVSVVSDPVRGTTNPLQIPGSVSQYAIVVSNTGNGRVDNNSVSLIDAIPANTRLYVALPVGSTNCSAVGAAATFVDGPTSTGLTFTAASNLAYSTDGGTTWTATPTWVFVPAAGGASPGCYASNVNALRLQPQGRMNALSSFSARFLVQLL